MKPSILDELWFEFQQAARDAGMDGSTVDWEQAFAFQWKRLDGHQQLAAIQGIRDRAGSDDAALMALPVNYLAKRMWERKIRGKNTKRSAFMEALDSL